MKKNLSLIAILIVIATLLSFSIKTTPDFHSSFVLHLETDITSSAANRLETADLTYQDSNLVAGTIKYISDDTLGQHFEYNCRLEDGTWITIDTKEDCWPVVSYPSTVTELKRRILKKEILPAGENCGHNQTCYTLL